MRSSSSSVADVVIMSGSPSQIPQLVGGIPGATELAERTRWLVQELAKEKPIELVGSREERWYTAHTGSLKAWGTPTVQVAEGNYLAEILQRAILLGAGVNIIASRGEINPINPKSVTLIAVDGSAGMTLRAPLALKPGAEKVDAVFRAFLAGESSWLPEAEELLEAGVIEPGLWIQLKELKVLNASLLSADTHLGVGRYLAYWQIEV